MRKVAGSVPEEAENQKPSGEKKNNMARSNRTHTAFAVLVFPTDSTIVWCTCTKQQSPVGPTAIHEPFL